MTDYSIYSTPKYTTETRTPMICTRGNGETSTIPMQQAKRSEMNSCTWVDCQQEATHQQNDVNGESWANLCLHHHSELRAAMAKSVPAMMAAWIKAQGGAKKASQRKGAR